MNGADTRPRNPRDLAPCGTPAAYRRHQRRGEKPCQACLLAARCDAAERKGADPWAFQRHGTAAPDRREIRNGLPAFRPYRYRGLGYDQLTAWMDDLEAAS